MDARIDAKINMYSAIKELYANNKADFDTVPAFEATFETFTTKYDDIKLNQQVADDTTKPSTAEKDNVKFELATATWKVADPVAGYADSIHDIILYDAMNVTAEMLYRTKDDRMEATCQDILDQANAVKVAAAPYGLTQDMLDDATALIPIWSAKASARHRAGGETVGGNGQPARTPVGPHGEHPGRHQARTRQSVVCGPQGAQARQHYHPSAVPRARQSHHRPHLPSYHDADQGRHHHLCLHQHQRRGARQAHQGGPLRHPGDDARLSGLRAAAIPGGEGENQSDNGGAGSGIGEVKVIFLSMYIRVGPGESWAFFLGGRGC